ncbi:type IV toxin-antitoxin system AbiEi family antitoxin domain-containing protein [Nocardioides speluncae]|uniref:type IV toxin-antitoxin system AbiEi family antitoxin domain-containing protein n=1 Tax=Nocardioides speluncae TaxID=2670337 RepID=UPI000D687DD2|nr:type IV toxin-antitoxin system AbiEi family antitoxin domain-containing protein [Nocardioides speluncae]
MDPVAALERLGGVASHADLRRLTSRKRLRTALKSGQVRRLRRGHYMLTEADRALVKARRIGGVVSHLSAAQLHGWEVAFPPALPWVTVPRSRVVPDRHGCHLFWANLDGESGDLTSPVRTVLDCARRLPFGPALAVADSALRHRDVSPERLVAEADQIRGKGLPPPAGWPPWPAGSPRTPSSRCSAHWRWRPASTSSPRPRSTPTTGSFTQTWSTAAAG